MSTPTDQPTTQSFTDLGVDSDLADALAEAGITQPFPVQELTLPLGLGGADVIGQARTGTGKTLAFGLPLVQRLRDDVNAVQALVIVPTRELCLQVAQDLRTAGAPRDVRVLEVFGGRPIGPQIETLQEGADIVVGTPGRLLDLLGRGALDLSRAHKLVLDEADEMLDLGFLPDVEQLIQACPDQRQTLLFSATMPGPVVRLARRYMSKPTFLRGEDEPSQVAPATEQYFFSCHRLDKPAVLARILQAPDRGLCLVFTRTKRMADQLANELRERDVNASPIHSDLRQEARERALRRFRDHKDDVLVATEVAARGLDITDVTHVVNYDCPDDEKMYLHRIGRTGRAGAAGVAITLAVWHELARLEMIKKALGVETPTHEVFSTSPLLDELFDLPPRGQAHRSPSTREKGEAGSSRGRGKQGDATSRGRGKQGGGKQGGGKQGPAREGGKPDRSSGGKRSGDAPREDAPREDATSGATQDAATARSGESEATADTTPHERGERSPTPRGEQGRSRRRTRSRRRGSDASPEPEQADGHAPAEVAAQPSGSDRSPSPDRSANSASAAAASSTRTDDSAEDGSGRVRRRTRRRSTTQGSGTGSGARSDGARADQQGAGTSDRHAADEPTADGAPQAGSDEAGAGPGERSAGGRGSGSQRRGGRNRGGRNRGGRNRGGRNRDQAGGDQASGDGQRDGQERGTSRSKDDGGDREQRGGGGGRRDRGRRGDGSGSRDGRSRDGRSRDGRKGNRRGGQRQRIPTADVPAETARGEGQPMIRRPLQVEHLP